jgi:hypothetical protein
MHFVISAHSWDQFGDNTAKLMCHRMHFAIAALVTVAPGSRAHAQTLHGCVVARATP